MYAWRQMTPGQRAEIMALRRAQRRPWHSPQHRTSSRTDRYLFTAACYEHRPIIGNCLDRMAAFEDDLLEVAHEQCKQVFAWVVLPNHYHFQAECPDLEETLFKLGRFHGRTSFNWNGEEGRRGRQVWCKAAETAMKSERHFWATVNYIHHNPVKHGLVERWQDWPFSSSASWLDQHGTKEAERVWKEYPIADYGRDWDF